MGMTTEMAKCFVAHKEQVTVEHKLRYFCVAKGVWDEAKADPNGKGLSSITDVDKKNKIHYLGEAEYHKNDGSNPGSAVYMQGVRRKLKNLKDLGEAEDELNFWNDENFGVEVTTGNGDGAVAPGA